MKKLLKVGVPALITSLISTVLSCFVQLRYYIYINKWFETGDRTYVYIGNTILFCSGFVIVLIISLANFIFKRSIERKTLRTYLLLTTLLYTSMMLILFPLSNNFMSPFIPSGVLDPGLSVLFHQVFSVSSATICSLVLGIKLKISK